MTYVIVGVLPPGFSGPDPNAADVWLPLQIAATGSRGDGWKHSGSGFYFTALVRLAPGVTAAAAATAATGGVQAARADLTWQDTEATVVLGPILKARGPADLGGDMQLPLVVGGVALAVLLIATANASNLLMLRVAARRRELAVRHALGAGRWGVGRLLVIESVLLAALSGVAALGVAAVAGRVLRVTLLPRYQWAGDPLEPTTIAFTAGAVLAVGLAAALFPAVYAARSRGIERLDGLRGARAPGAPVRTGLIVVQAALSLVLLDGAAIFYRSFEAARQLDIGYAKENLLTVQLGGTRDGAQLTDSSVATMETRVRFLPGVLDVAQGTELLQCGGPDHPRRPRFHRVGPRGHAEGRDRQLDVRPARLAGRNAVGRCLFVGGEATDARRWSGWRSPHSSSVCRTPIASRTTTCRSHRRCPMPRCRSSCTGSAP